MSQILLSLLLVFSISARAEKSTLWVYSSVYNEFIAPIEAAFEKKYPDIDVQVFQAGSEKIQAKIEAEIQAGKIQADIVMSSDPFWSHDIVSRGLAELKPKALEPDTNYYSLMILIAHKDFPKEKRPKSFLDLSKSEFKDIVQMGSPLESGTAFSTVAHLSRKYSWDFFTKLRANNIASNGGNSTVIQKVETSEKMLGVVLLENALAARKRGSPIEIIYPVDGGVIIPSVQVILKASPNHASAEKFALFLLAKEGQELLRNGFMYSVRKDVPAPEGAINFSEVTKISTVWSPDFIKSIAAESREIKKKFSQIVLR